MHRSRRQNRRGFTLVEVMAAGVILALSASVLSLGVRQSLRSLGKARDYQQAAELLDRIMTKTDMFGAGRIRVEGPNQGGFPPPHDRFRWQTQIESADTESDLYEVTVRIAWVDPNGYTQYVEAQTLLYDPPRLAEQELSWEDV